MHATFKSIVEEMHVVENHPITGFKKRDIVLAALEAAGWVNDSNKSDISKYIDLICWISKRPELMIAINAAKTSCCIAS